MTRTESSVRRRTVVRTAVWASPVIIVGAPAPATAASACSPQVVDWQAIASQYGVTKIPTDGSARKTYGKTSVQYSATGALGGVNNSTIGTTGGSSTLLLTTPTGTSNTAQTVTVNFNPQVTNVVFSINDLDQDPKYYIDQIIINTGGYVFRRASNGTTGDGSSGAPFTGGTSVADDSPAGNLALSWKGPVSQISFTYQEQNAPSANPAPHVGISNIQFTPTSC